MDEVKNEDETPPKVVLYNKKIFAEKLNDLRSNKDLSFQQLSDGIKDKTKVSISGTQLSKYENSDNEVIISLNNLFALANYYEVSIYNLLGMNDCKDADNEEIHKRLELSEEAIEFLSTLVKRKKFEGENIKDAYFMIKTINFLLEQENNISFLSTLSDFLWHEYKTENTDGCDTVMLEDLAGVKHLFSLSEMDNIKILEIQQLLTSLKDISKAENIVKDNKNKK